jgi:hypothetical protein
VFFFLIYSAENICSMIDNGEGSRLSALRLRGPRGAKSLL